jgi:hypothetical protein
VRVDGGGRSAGPGDGHREIGRARAGDLVARVPRENPAAPPPTADAAPMTATCVKVLLVEAATLAALWIFQVVFSGP